MIPRSRRRLVGLYAVALAMLVALSGRLWYLQVLDTQQYKALAQVNGTRSIVVPAVRGMITDDTGAALVTNQVSMTVAVNMMQLSQTTRTPARPSSPGSPRCSACRTRRSPRRCGCVPAASRSPAGPGSPYQPIPVAENVSDAIALQIMEEPTLFPGVTAQVSPIVDYPMPDGANPAQALGYLQPITQAEMAKYHLPETGFAGDNLVGQSGLEAQYNAALTGKAGTRIVSVNAAGDVLGTVGGAAPQTGDTLVTSLNAKVQAVAQQALNSAIAKARAAGNDADQGAAIVETTTGQIVAMASYPDYNPNVWSSSISQHEVNYLFGLGSQSGSGQPALNWATQGQYAPGSTFKVTSTAAAVADGFPLHGLYACPASVNIGGHSFINDGEPGMGAMTFEEALIKSCDTVYYNLGYEMYQRDDRAANNVLSAKAPVQKMQAMELAWGFGKYTGVDLPEESTGTIPTRQWLYWMWQDNAHKGQNWCKNGREHGSYVQQIEWENCQDGWVWEPGQAAIAAIGQGYVTATPLQLTNAYTALADGGTLYAPRLAQALVSPAGKVVQRINPPVIRHLPVASETLSYMRHALAGVVTSGTAAGAFAGFPLNKVCVAGKTGTAQIMGKVATSVFASFAPCNNPKLRRRGHAAEFRLRRGRRGPGGPADLGRHLRP